MFALIGSKTVKLAQILGDGAQATVYAVPGNRHLAAKVYKASQKVEPQRISHLIDNPPRPLWDKKHKAPFFAWPEGPVSEPNTGHVLGYTMPRIDKSISIEEACNPSIKISAITQRFLLDVAISYLLRLTALHWESYVGFDHNVSNIRVTRWSEVCFIDCDCVQFKDKTGQPFLAQCGRPETLPPECLGQGLSFDDMERTKVGDLWTAAVTVHRTLRSGRHPFSFQYLPIKKGARKPPLLESIRKGFWPDSGKFKEYAPPRNVSPTWGQLPTSLRELFKETFEDGFSDPQKRPQLSRWITTLQDIRTSRFWK